MKRLCLHLTLLLVLAGTVTAQEVTRVVVLPFSATSANEAYSLGLATALQRSLNVVDNVYAPPVGDTFLYTRRLADQGVSDPAAVLNAFGADVITTGQITDANDLLVSFSGPAYPEIKTVNLGQAAAAPPDLSALVVDAVVAELQLPLSAGDREELAAVSAQTPSLESLNPVAEGALRLPSTTLIQLRTAADLDPGSSWVQSEYARSLALTGDIEAALSASLRATELAPDDVEAWVVRGVVLQTAGDTESAVQAYDAALALNPAHALALFGKGTLTEDETLLEAAIAAYPRLANAYLTLAQLQEGNPQRALQILRRGTAAIPESATLHGAFMQIALRAGDAAGALSYLQGVIGGQPSPPPTLYALASLLPEAYDNEALALLNQGLERYPNQPNLAVSTATVLQRNGDAQGAETLLANTLLVAPQNADVANALALLQARRGDTDAARTTLAASGGDNDITRFNLAQLYVQSGQVGAALETLEPLVQANPDDADLQTLYGVALGGAGRVDQANAAFDRALELDPTSERAQRSKSLLNQQAAVTGDSSQPELSAEAAAAFNEGRNAFAEEDYAAAAQAFTRARAAQDEGIIAFFQGLSEYLNGRPREATEAYARALESYPESDTILNNLGLAQTTLGRYDLALGNLERAVQLNDANANAHLNLGLVNYELGRYQEAVTAWERAIALNSGLASAVADRLGDAKAKLGQ